MKMLKKYKPELIVSKDNGRPLIENAYYKDGRLIATDGKRLIIVPVENEDGDTAGLVSAQAIKLSKKNKQYAKSLDISIKLNGDQKLLDGSTLPRPSLGSPYPNVNAVIPPKDRKERLISFDVFALCELAEALGCDKSGAITIGISDVDGEAVRVMSYDNDESVTALMMPMRLNRGTE